MEENKQEPKKLGDSKEDLIDMEKRSDTFGKKN